MSSGPSPFGMLDGAAIPIGPGPAHPTLAREQISHEVETRAHPGPRTTSHPGRFHLFLASDSWLTSRRVMSEGREILLSGWGRRPTEEQVRLRISIEGRIEELVAKAVAAIQARRENPGGADSPGKTSC